MVSKLEKQFFDTFKIPKRFILPIENFKYSYKNYKEAYKINRACNDWEHQETINELKKGKYEYPTITDRILLELICIIGAIYICARDKETLKEHILVQCMVNNKDIKPQIQALFKEG